MEDGHGEKCQCECVHSTCGACIIVVQVLATVGDLAFPLPILVASGPTVADSSLGTPLHGPLTVSTLTSPPHNFRNRVFLSRALPILYVLQNPVLVPWRLKRDAISTEMIAVAL